MTDRVLFEKALKALEYAAERIGCPDDDDAIGVARKALRERLAQPEQDAVLAEREACAQIADIAGPYQAADLIRARSKDPMLFDDWGSIPYGGSK